MAENNGNYGKNNRKQKDAEKTPPEVILPHDLSSEAGLIGAILKNNDVYDEVAGIVTPEDFFDQTNRSIFEAISREMLRTDGMSATPILIASRYFSTADGLNRTAKETMDAAVMAAVVGDPKHYAKTVVDLAKRRNAHKAFAIGANSALDPKNISYIDDVFAALEKRGETSEIEDMAALSDKLLDDIERLAAGEIIEESGIGTGFKCLDAIMSPICPGNYVTIAAPTGQGKTSLGTQLAYNMAKQGSRVAYFTLEMSSKSLRRALTAMVAGVDKKRFKPGGPSEEDVTNWRVATADLKNLSLQVIDAQGQTPEQIFAQVRTLVRKQNIDVVFIDYFGKIAMNGRFASEQERANRKSGMFQQMAGKLKIPFIILHQLNREVYKRPDKTPQLTDIRDTGAIENDSDLVLFIQRSDFALQMSEPDPSDMDKHREWRDKMEKAGGKSTIWLKKDRQTGAVGKIELSYNGIGQYREIDQKYTAPANTHTGYGDHMRAKK